MGAAGDLAEAAFGSTILQGGRGKGKVWMVVLGTKEIGRIGCVGGKCCEAGRNGEEVGQMARPQARPKA